MSACPRLPRRPRPPRERLAPHTTHLLRLLDEYDASELDAALADALAREALSAWAIAHRLDQRARARRSEDFAPGESGCMFCHKRIHDTESVVKGGGRVAHFRLLGAV